MDVDGLLGEMTPDEKVGQLLLLAFDPHDLDAAEMLFERYFVGGSYLSNDNLPTPDAAARMTSHIQAVAARTRLAVPVLLGADQEGAWSVMYPGSCPGPGNMALGASGDPDHARAMYRVIGQEIRDVGLHATFGPCADCNTNPANVAIGTRSFGESPELVAAMTRAAVEGVLSAHAIPTLKHFPGHGDTTIDSHRGLPTVSRDRDELMRTDLAPFAQGIAAGAPLVMTAHILFPALDRDRPATLSPLILGEILRGELGFEGAVISDSMNMHSMRRNYDPVEAAISAVNAGVDIVMLAEEHYDHDAEYLKRQLTLVDGIRSAVREGRITESRLDEAVGRTLRLKAGIGDWDLEPQAVGREAHRAVELAAARAAVTILRGTRALLPVPHAAPLTLVNTIPRGAYGILGSTRGIGPNQTEAAFDLFVDAVRRRSPAVRVMAAEEVLAGERPPSGALIVAVTENHPLPGVDFDRRARPEILRALVDTGQPVQVIALGDPYELGELPFVDHYACAFSFRWCAAEAAAELLFGEIEPRGRSPVSVPSAGIQAG